MIVVTVVTSQVFVHKRGQQHTASMVSYTVRSAFERRPWHERLPREAVLATKVALFETTVHSMVLARNVEANRLAHGIRDQAVLVGREHHCLSEVAARTIDVPVVNEKAHSGSAARCSGTRAL
eukprot:3321234-Prymnesium_polylepis.1